MMEIRSGISNKYIIVKIYFYYVMKKLLEWWSNTRFCKIMHDKWAANIANNIINSPYYNTYIPSYNSHNNKKEFKETDWWFKPGDLCFYYLYWFFGTHKIKCNILERQISTLYINKRKIYITSYKIQDLNGNIYNNVRQDYLDTIS